jgi:hypothetical protein
MKTLEIILSLAGIFLLYSLLATIIQELIAQLLGLRARMLIKSISRMLDEVDDKMNLWKFICLPFRAIKKFFAPFDGRSLAEKFYSQPSIQFLGAGRLFTKPSYFSAETFSSTLLRMLRGEKYDGTKSQMDEIKTRLKNKVIKFDEDTHQYLNDLILEANDDLEKFKAKLEDWYTETQERVTGWYKRESQFILFFIGLLFAVVFNIDTIEITNRLSNDDNLRSQMVQIAVSMADSSRIDTAYLSYYIPPKDSVKAFTSVDYKIDLINKLQLQADSVNNILGLGWICKNKDTSGSTATPGKKNKNCHCYTLPQRPVGKAILGWLITALAISLGSPFWFDLLNKLVKLRGSGLIPDDTSKQPAATAKKSKKKK